MEENKNTKLTDEQINNIAEQLDESIKGTNLEKIAQFPSNNGKETTDEKTREEGYYKPMNVAIDPITGEHKILGEADCDEDNETFEEMCERINNSDLDSNANLDPITEKELINYITNVDNNSILTELTKDIDLKPETIRELLLVVNRKINKEEFNVYRALPEEVRVMIDKYLVNGQIPAFTNEGKRFRNMVSEQLISEFITNISLDKTMVDFNKELESLFEKGSSELADSVIGYTKERSKKYREYADGLEDQEKKEKMNHILDRIDEASTLTEMKEFAKSCKIKPFEFEKPEKVYKNFLYKYKESTYNIYDIAMARPILYRNINPCIIGIDGNKEIKEVYTSKDIDAFFLCFCKQCKNYKVDVVFDHAYMYYVIYNIVLLDMNKGASKEVSDKFLDNVKEVISNLKEKNKF